MFQGMVLRRKVALSVPGRGGQWRKTAVLVRKQQCLLSARRGRVGHFCALFLC